MMYGIQLLSYCGEKIDYEIPDFENLEYAKIAVLSGDELLTLHYTDGYEIEYDPFQANRLITFFDYEYEVYNKKESSDSLIKDPKFLYRQSSYWMWDYDQC